MVGCHVHAFMPNKLCAWRHNMPPPPAIDNIFVFIRHVAPVPACWLFKTSATSWPLTFWKWFPSQCDVGYLCANFSLPRPLRHTSSLNASALWGQRHNNRISIAPDTVIFSHNFRGAGSRLDQ